jgi:dTDP-4-amino-4,6-dideoxygalactose transaminase
MAHLFDEPPPTAGLPISLLDFLPSKTSLEEGLAVFLQQEYVQIESSGTAAIMVALTALKRLSDRRSVIIPAYTCPFVPLAILRCGLKPIICDTKKHHFDFHLESLDVVCDKDTLAIMPTHLGGRVADLAGIMKIAQQCGAYVVEDAAQALGARWQGQLVGTLGDVGCYSLGVGKGLTIYGGGAVIARESNVRHVLQTTHSEIVPFNLILEVQRLLGLIGYYAFYRPLSLSLVFGIPLRKNLQRGKLIEAVGDDCSANFPVHHVGRWRKAIGAKAMQRLPAFHEASRKQARSRKAQLSEILGLNVMDDAEGDVGTWPYLLVLMPTQRSRDAALAELWSARLGVGRLFIHALCDYDYLPFSQVDTPNARDFAARTLTITNSPWLKDDDFLKICEVLERVIG